MHTGSSPEAVERAAGIVPYARWQARAEELAREYAAARPYPVVVLDDFLTPEAAWRAVTTFPTLENEGWINYLRINERTFGMRDRRTMPGAAAEILDELNSDDFVSLLTAITGIPSLRSDHSLEGAGLHLSDRGGFLNVHADFNVHPHQPRWRRRLNLLIYLNPDWDESWGGHLELWDADVQRCVQRIAPIFNRAVLFRTDERSFHGFPDRLRCPADVTRKSLALYYFTVEETPPRVRSTNHRARPGDGIWRRALIGLDRTALWSYDRTKRILGFDDALMSRLLKALSRRRSAAGKD